MFGGLFKKLDTNQRVTACYMAVAIVVCFLAWWVLSDGSEALEETRKAAEPATADSVVDHGSYVTVRYNGNEIRYEKADLEPMPTQIEQDLLDMQMRVKYLKAQAQLTVTEREIRGEVERNRLQHQIQKACGSLVEDATNRLMLSITNSGP